MDWRTLWMSTRVDEGEREEYAARGLDMRIVNQGETGSTALPCRRVRCILLQPSATIYAPPLTLPSTQGTPAPAPPLDTPGTTMPVSQRPTATAALTPRLLLSCHS